MDKVTLAWASMLVLQILGWAMLQCLHEILFTVDYIEHHLKPKLKELVHTDSFWQWEPYIAEWRSRPVLFLIDRCGLILLFVFGFGAACWVLKSNMSGWTRSSFAWLGANSYVTLMVIGKAWFVVKSAMPKQEPSHSSAV